MLFCLKFVICCVNARRRPWRRCSRPARRRRHHSRSKRLKPLPLLICCMWTGCMRFSSYQRILGAVLGDNKLQTTGSRTGVISSLGGGQTDWIGSIVALPLLPASDTRPIACGRDGTIFSSVVCSPIRTQQASSKSSSTEIVAYQLQPGDGSPRCATDRRRRARTGPEPVRVNTLW